MTTSESTSERTMAPTKRRLAEARSRGEVARSGDLSAAVLTVGALIVLAVGLGHLVGQLTDMMRILLSDAGSVPDAAAWASVKAVAGSLGIILVSLLALAVAANVMQIGLLTATKRVGIDWSRISLSAGLRKSFSVRTFVRMLQILAKLGIVSAVTFIAVRNRMDDILACCAASPAEILTGAGDLLLGVGLRVGAVLFVLGLGDLLYQKWQWRRDLRMTRREFLDEMKDGAPGLAARSRHGSHMRMKEAHG